MSQKWNLQDIRPPEARRPRRSGPTTDMSRPRPEHELSSREDIPSIVIENGKKLRSYRLFTAVAIFVVLIVGAFFVANALGTTVITVYPQYREPTVNEEFTAYPEPRLDNLSYTVLTIEESGERQVKATGQIQVQEQSKGFIEIMKSTPGTERLIKNTRFRSPNGLIFRIQESVVVPGAIRDESGALVPGSIRAEVFADDVGEQYNLAAGTNFDVPGFSESNLTELFGAIKAVNREPMTGGFDGPQFQIAEDELGTAKQSLQMELRDKLLARVGDAKPAGTVLFDGAIALSFSTLPAVQYGNDLVTIKEVGVMQVPLFDEIELGSFLAKKVVTTYGGEPVKVDNPSALLFTYTDQAMSGAVIANELSLGFKLVGKPLLIWQYDSQKLAADLATLPKTSATRAFAAYPSIKGGSVKITPPWKTSFPQNPEEITIVNELKELP